MKKTIARTPLNLFALLFLVLALASSARAATASVSVGQAVTFTVTAAGTQPFAYQWRKNGVSITGATSPTLALAAAQTTDSGDYSVQVTNSAGSTLSDTGSLSVNPVILPPTIAAQPAAVTVTAGQPATFSVSVSGTAPYTYCWRKDGVDVAGANDSTYTIANTSLTTAGFYSVVVSNSAGSTVSASALLTVNPLIIAPAVVTGPSSLTVTEGESASFSVVATGTAPLAYQWLKDGVTIAGATDSTYTISATNLTQAGSYRVQVTNPGGSVSSGSAILTVKPAIIAPSITTQPAALTVTEGEAASFTVAAAGSAPLAYQWTKDGTPIGGATQSSLTLSPASLADAATYAVVVSNPGGFVNSAGATLTVNRLIIAPTITTGPAALTVTEGDQAVFNVTASGTDPLGYQWRKDGTDIAGATSSTYTISASTASCAGSYSVTVSNPAGSAMSAVALLTVKPALTAPSIVSGPTGLTVTEGQSASFTVAASGSDPLAYQWRKDGVPIAGATSATYTIATSSLGSAGVYSVAVSNAAGAIVSNGATLTVNRLIVAPVITAPPAALTVAIGAKATFTVSATGTGPLSYQWRKNGSRIYGATSPTYTIAATRSTSAGTYSVTVSNTAGSVTSPGATLTLLTLPAITAQPSSISVAVGKTASFAVSVSGSSPITYQWRKNGISLPGATTNSYSIATVCAADAGTYSVVISNPVGAATSVGATLSVLVPPSITTPPASTTVRTGDKASFTVVAAGTDPLTYQWRKLRKSRGTYADIAGATSATYVIDVADSADAGTYCVVVRNSLGSVTSPAATLRVSATTTSSLTSTSTLQESPLVTLSTDVSSGPSGTSSVTGFTVSGGPKVLLIRSATGALASSSTTPLKIYAGTTEVAANTGWKKSPAATDIQAAARDLSLAPLADGDRAVLLAFPAGVYTTSGVGPGAGKIDIYDVDRENSTQLARLTCTGLVGRNGSVIQGQLTVGGTAPRSVLIRAVGPGLAAFGVEDALARPNLRVLSRDGSTVAENSGWSRSPSAAACAAAGVRVGALPLAARSADAAVLVNLRPGTYTLKVSALGRSAGTAWLEVYAVEDSDL